MENYEWRRSKHYFGWMESKDNGGGIFFGLNGLNNWVFIIILCNQYLKVTHRFGIARKIEWNQFSLPV